MQDRLRKQLSSEASDMVRLVTPYLSLSGFELELVEENYIKIIPKGQGITVFGEGGESIERAEPGAAAE